MTKEGQVGEFMQVFCTAQGFQPGFLLVPQRHHTEKQPGRPVTGRKASAVRPSHLDRFGQAVRRAFSLTEVEVSCYLSSCASGRQQRSRLALLPRPEAPPAREGLGRPFGEAAGRGRLWGHRCGRSRAACHRMRERLVFVEERRRLSLVCVPQESEVSWRCHLQLTWPPLAACSALCSLAVWKRLSRLVARGCPAPALQSRPHSHKLCCKTRFSRSSKSMTLKL